MCQVYGIDEKSGTLAAITTLVTRFTPVFSATPSSWIDKFVCLPDKRQLYVSTYYRFAHIFVGDIIQKQTNLMLTGRARVLYLLMLLCIGLLPASGTAASMPDSTISLTFNCIDGFPGDTVCIPVVVENFDSIQSIQLGFNFDPTVLRFINVRNEALNDGFPFQSGPDDIRYIWTDPLTLTADLPDGTTLLEVCLEIIGLPGEISPFELNASYDQEISKVIEGQTMPVPLDATDCVVNVLVPTDIGVNLTACGAPSGIGDGTFGITVFGGTEPYMYTWVNTANGAINGSSNLNNSGDSESQSVPPGTYDITVTDNDGTMVMYTVIVPTLGLEYSMQGFDPTCFNFTNGRIAVEVANGQPPYSLIWRNNERPAYSGSAFMNLVDDSRNIPSLIAGTYDITLIDANGCTVMETVELMVDSFYIDALVQDATCIGSMDGSVSISISGANPLPGGVYEVEASWIPGVFQTNMVNTPAVLDPGEYSITVSDAINNCDTVFTFTVGSTTSITGDIVTQDPTCRGSADGQITVTGLTNGSSSGPYTFQLLDANGGPIGPPVDANPTVFFDDRPGGTYHIVISDGPCSSDTIPVILNNPGPLTVTLVDMQPAGCNVGSTDGEITVQAMGGTVGPGSDYTYSWNGGALMGSTISNLSFGNYMLTVTDDNGCTVDTAFTLPRSEPVINGFNITNISCTGDSTATVEVLVTPGDGAITQYIWSTGGSGPVVTNQPPGFISVTIRDENNCFAISDTIVPSGTGLMIDSVRLESPTCIGESNGQFTVFVSGGTAPISYIWSTGDTTNFNLLPSLSMGMYSVTVTSSDTCGSVDTTVFLPDPPALGFAFSNVVDATCADICDGEATLTPSGGDPGLPYEFIWESGQLDDGFSSTATGLCPGWQTVIISQDNICFFTDSVLIPSPPPVGIDTILLSDVTCHGMNDGIIHIDGTGGSGGYQITWDSGLPPGTFHDNLAAGAYAYTVTDAGLCSYSDTIVIREPDSLIMQIDSSRVSGISCNNPLSGLITVETIGGTPGYDYNWNPNVSTSSMASGLAAGLYQITVTDIAGCTDTASYRLTGTDPVMAADPVIIQPQCFGDDGMLTIPAATGGVGGYTFTVSNNGPYPLDSLITVPIGFYVLTVSDTANCTDSIHVTVQSPPPISISVLPENPIVDLGDSLQLQLIIEDTQGGVDSILWIPGSPGDQISCNDCGEPYVYNAVPGIYTVTVWDSAGCMSTLDVFVDVNENRKVYIPNVFSPNFDGRNDEFKIFTGQGVTGIESVQVFDRWGELMISVPNPPIGSDGATVWDGSFNGSEMQPGVYVYVAKVSFIDGVTKIYRGDVTLLR